MKYANLVLDGNEKMVNIGDCIQLIAIENLYRHIGVNYNSVKRIKVKELSTYSGEKVVLPINFPMFGYYNLPKKITPVYLGISIMSNTCADGLRFSENQPIGCRDVHTYNETQKIGLDSYIASCLTLTFPEKKQKTGAKSVFLVDIPKKLIPYIPDFFKKNAVYKTQLFYNDNCPDEAKVKEIYNSYFNEASLVVTSKIHVAMPCIATGIPVIFACDSPSFRYTLLNKIIPVYIPETFKHINWSPAPVNIEKRKSTMLEYAALRVRSAFEENSIGRDTHKKYQSILNQYYSNTDSTPFKNATVDAFEKYISSRYSCEESFEYALWGVTQIAELTYAMMKNKFPNAKLIEVIDMFRETSFHGVNTSDITSLQKLKETIVLVTVGAANNIAEAYFKQYQNSKHCIYYNGLHVEDGKRISVHGII